MSELGSPGASPLSDETRGGDRGPQYRVPGLCHGEVKGKVVYRSERSQVCQAGESSTHVEPVIAQQSGVLSLVSCKPGTGLQRDHSGKGSLSARQDLYGWEDVFTVKLPKKFCLELFSGTSRITTCLRQRGLACFPVDICLSPTHNVLDVGVEHAIVNWIISGRIQFLWVGMPCTSFSRARKWDGLGPGPLRDEFYLWGLPELSWRDKHKVQQGNDLLRFTLRILKLCMVHHVAFALENPTSSFAWEMPNMVAFLKEYQLTVVYLDFCQYGEPWRKPTSILGYRWPAHTISRLCQPHRGLCSFSQCRHIPLRGVDKKGRFLTLMAQPYPWMLAEEVSRVVAKAVGVREQASL